MRRCNPAVEGGTGGRTPLNQGRGKWKEVLQIGGIEPLAFRKLLH